MVQVEGKTDNTGKTDATTVNEKTQAAKKRLEDEAKKQAEQKRIADEAKKQAEQKRIADEAKQKGGPPKVVDVKAPLNEIKTGDEEIPPEPADLKPVVLGNYQPNAGAPDVTLQREEADKGNWVRLALTIPRSLQSVR